MDQILLNKDAPPEKETLFGDIILPVPIPRLFTYRIPFSLNKIVKIGSRVIVQFGSRKILTGVIGDIHKNPPQKYEAKYILELLDEEPSLFPIQLEFLKWMSAYYMCNIGEALQVALPSGLKLTSQSKIQLNPDYSTEEEGSDFSEREQQVLQALQHQSSLSYSEIPDIIGIKQIHPLLKSLLQKEAVLLFEEVRDKYSPKVEKRIRLSSNYLKEEKLSELLDQLEKKPKQADVLLKYLQLVPVHKEVDSNQEGIEKKVFLESGISSSSLNTLTSKNIFEAFEKVVSRFDSNEIEELISIDLSDQQLETKEEIHHQFKTNEVVLLQGVTGSGKTEIYIRLIEEALESGSQVLYLLPEIALTTQIVKRLKKIFGSSLGIYHSKFSDNERVEVWRGVLEGRFSFIIGVRSAIFLPFDNLGLVIVDEEHENSYKQFDPAPRYHARDSALVLAQMHQAKTLLGSATPSVESWYLAQSGKFGFVSLEKRYGDSKLPEIILSNIREETKRKLTKGEFSSVLIQSIQDSLDKNEQVIVFQNRRGYAPYLICQECGFIPKCENCSVSLTYHLYAEDLRCHYCGFREKPAPACPACGSPRLEPVGFGTEKLEEDLQAFFPEARIQRMDLDTTRSKYSYQKILDGFEEGEINILVGTQMVSKGLDFDHVSLVGILDVDRMIHFPDFRSEERSFQLITQVSGRAGRREKRGQVIIQTREPGQPILKTILSHHMREFYDLEIEERRKFHFPPYTRLVKVTVKHLDRQVAQQASLQLFQNLRKGFKPGMIHEPHEPLISKIRNQYLIEILMKFDRNLTHRKSSKDFIREQISNTLADKNFRKVNFVIDVDPY